MQRISLSHYYVQNKNKTPPLKVFHATWLISCYDWHAMPSLMWLQSCVSGIWKLMLEIFVYKDENYETIPDIILK